MTVHQLLMDQKEIFHTRSFILVNNRKKMEGKDLSDYFYTSDSYKISKEIK